ncbi:ankyrin-2-like [Haliotis rufescens]|uniref:ankyrin-2-like n=1 Tax=Haliotis rufescens TaxID=6454 RepID=UPI00201F49C6|nr:ankyrin-2-like [Haliotis rufescens]
MDGDLSRVQCLLSEGLANINATGLHRRTSVMFAAEKAHKDVFDLLVREGADLLPVDDDDNSIFLLACEGGNIDIVQYLLTQNATDINRANKDKQTSAMKAAFKGHEDVFGLLVGKGTELSLTESYRSRILHLACKGGNIEIVNYLLTEALVDINSTDENNYTPAIIAATAGHRNVFDLLVVKGADLTILGDDDNSVLHAASLGGNIEIVRNVLTLNIVNINARDIEGMTPVFLAALNGHDEVFDLLVEKEADLLIVTDGGNTILHAACRGGNVQIVKYVLNQNIVDVNSKEYSGLTPAMEAAVGGHKAVFYLLLEKRPDLSQPDDHDNNLLHMACEGGNVELVKYVLALNSVDINSRTEDGRTPAMIAASKGHKDMLKLLVNKGADLSLVNSHGEDVLHISLLCEDMEMVKYILTQDVVNINGADKDGRTPVSLAAENGCIDMFDLVVSKGADLSSRDVAGNTILQSACSGGNVDIVEYVLAQDNMLQDINRTGWNDWTPVMVAAFQGYKEVFDLLVKKGADLAQLDKDGNTILHMACMKSWKIVKFLLSRNIVDINSRGSNGTTPLMVTACSGSKAVFELLMRKGANPSLVDKDGNNILHLACSGTHFDIVKYIVFNAIVDLTLSNKLGFNAAKVALAAGNEEAYNFLLSQTSI